MNRKDLHIGLILLFISVLLSGCKKDNVQLNPDFSLSTNLIKGLTTDVFVLSIEPEDQIPQDEKLYGRWDWEGDSIFNTRFNDDMEVQHRFLKPGSYSVMCEVMNLSGNKASDSIKIVVEQGYSAPKAKFTVIPESGNYKTTFAFDASYTVDDEDSLETLLFRWDFQDDGLWDTPFSNEPTASHKYDLIDDFVVKLEVVDPKKKYASVFETVVVHNIDTCIRPNFTWWSANGRVSDTVEFDASSSYHQNDPEKELFYKWIFPDEEYPDFADTADTKYKFHTPGEKKVVLVVKDDDGLQNSIEKKLFMAIENTPPRPHILTPSLYGSRQTQFFFNLRQSLDDHTATSKLLFRWDFDGDSVWDTNQNSDLEVYYQYGTAGIYTCFLEAEDEEGLRDTTSIVLDVSPYDYQTGYLKDKRDNKYYGTVKIGDQWWMSQNLDYRIPPKEDLPHVQKCIFIGGCERFGSLYALEFANAYMATYHDNICPEGWHIPSQEEMEKLIENVEYPGGMNALIPHGSSGFNALFGGYITYTLVFNVILNSWQYKYMYKDSGFSTYFMTTTHWSEQVYPRIYTLNIQTNYAELYPIKTHYHGYYSLRCVKD